ncbi:hypothetical protein IV52_GL000144 [Fructilactobacillus lindneri DSM 20690 = JCM 11027]|uniref:Uncharacterized protein n=1 Tax=Fructilactobacillus lindneri DSM 20690 = JCM 11027 TaxID=1122148 RepID=A0A0R2K024_9LACO|nr:hypothetical protein IV52_GL000144 [Fructilactobacillus lindneri DSM 20690 = JCM 11027]
MLIALLLIIITTVLYEIAKHTKGSKREQAYRNAHQAGWIKRVLNQLMRFIR